MSEFKSNSGRKPAGKGFDRNGRDSGKPGFKKDLNKATDFKKTGNTGDDRKRSDNKRSDQNRNDFKRPDNKRVDQKRPDYNKSSNKKFDKNKPDYMESEKPFIQNTIDVQSLDQENAGNDRLEGRNPVLEALKAGRTINKILVAKGEREGSIKQIIAMAKEKGIVLQETDRRNLDGLSLTKAHQGVIAYVSVKEYVEVDDILKVSELRGEPPFIIILDEIVDANNFGSILRTADAVGAHGVIIPKRRSVGLTPAVAKASAGAVEYVPVSRVSNLAQTIEYLKKKNVWVIGTDQTGEKEFYNSDLKGSIALVIGSEGEGMGRLVREKCDFVVNIPMMGNVSSLNAAVAGAVVMFEIMKQRGR